jgi:hypothetical protein
MSMLLLSATMATLGRGVMVDVVVAVEYYWVRVVYVLHAAAECPGSLCQYARNCTHCEQIDSTVG